MPIVHVFYNSNGRPRDSILLLAMLAHLYDAVLLVVMNISLFYQKENFNIFVAFTFIFLSNIFLKMISLNMKIIFYQK